MEQQGLLFGPQGKIFLNVNEPVIVKPDFRDALSEFLKFNEPLVEDTLGEFGLRLMCFAKSIDLSHSDIENPLVFKKIFENEDENFLTKLCNMLKLADYAQSEKMLDLIPSISKAAIGKISPELKFLDTPVKTQRFVRLIGDRATRDGIRSTKNSQEIDLRTFQKKGVELWENLPENFSFYTRYNTAYKDEISKAEKKIEKYKALGCKELYTKIEDAVEVFKESFENSYHGFHRITMTNTAVILAKMQGFFVSQTQEDVGYHQYNSIKIVAKPSRVTNPKVHLDNKVDLLVYTPKAYPYHEMSVDVPERVKTLVEYLEAFPPANGKSAFDHYVVIVPGLAQHSFIWKERVVRNELQRKLDFTLIEEKLITPVVLGERDGMCYFLCYWC